MRLGSGGEQHFGGEAEVFIHQQKRQQPPGSAWPTGDVITFSCEHQEGRM